MLQNQRNFVGLCVWPLGDNRFSIWEDVHETFLGNAVDLLLSMILTFRIERLVIHMLLLFPDFVSCTL